MRNLMKLIVITALAALLICAAMTCAMADEQIYTSPVFKLPVDRLEAEEWAEGQPEEEIPEEQPAEEIPDEDEQPETTQAPDGETVVEPAEEGKPQRYVRIYTSQGDVVTDGEIINLTSELIGFEGLDVSYQWQCDKNDGAGWFDIEGATRDRFTFIANKETIQYSWRLIVNINE